MSRKPPSPASARPGLAERRSGPSFVGSRRLASRVRPSGVEIQVVARAEDGTTVHCHVAGLSALGAELRIPTEATELAVGQPLVLHFLAPGLDLVIPAIVEQPIGGSSREYAVRFPAGALADEGLAAAVSALFERREHPRLQLVHPVFVAVSDPGGRTWSGPLWDISAGGLSFVLDTGDSELATGRAVVARFSLPGAIERFVIAGRAIPRGEVPSGSRWAVVFDRDDVRQLGRLGAALAHLVRSP